MKNSWRSTDPCRQRDALYVTSFSMMSIIISAPAFIGIVIIMIVAVSTASANWRVLTYNFSLFKLQMDSEMPVPDNEWAIAN